MTMLWQNKTIHTALVWMQSRLDARTGYMRLNRLIVVKVVVIVEATALVVIMVVVVVVVVVVAIIVVMVVMDVAVVVIRRYILICTITSTIFKYTSFCSCLCLAT